MTQESVTTNNEVAHIDDDDFEAWVTQSEKPVLVDFWADWCQPCQMMAPTLDALAVEYGDRVQVAKMDVDANPMTSHKYGIRSIPTLLLFKDGKVVQQMVGVKPKEEVVRIIDNNL